LKKKESMKRIALCLLFAGILSCQGTAQPKKETKTYRVVKTDAEWQEQLSELSYYVLRKAGTERPFSNPYNKNYDTGTYVCQGCGTPLYKSDDKFDSGTGWPSFDRGFDANLEYDVDYKLGYARTELKCSNCGGHLGHMFDDGPKQTTGKRHCINSAALQFISEDEKK
jgi:peptide-methionine (R)-S-oxide reductase